MPPNPLTHLSLPDRSEMQLQSEADRRSLPGTWTRSSPEHTTILRGGVRRCLQQQCEQTVRIVHAKVAQKSYGNEKRFFCPPPCVYLSGPGWRVKPGQDQAHQAGETGPTVCGYMGLDSASGSAAETQKLNFEQQPDSRVRAHGKGSDSCSHPCLSWERRSPLSLPSESQEIGGETGRPRSCLKAEPESLDGGASGHLRRGGRPISGRGWFIRQGRAGMRRPYPREPPRNSAAPRPCTSQMQTRGSTSGWCCGWCCAGAGNWEPSTAASSRSSRSPRRKSSRSKTPIVSLFNRLRSQTVSTRYLSVEDGAFVASARQWAAFTLHLADGHSSQGDFPPREGYVRYGSLVQLVCTLTGITLPPMIIRKVAKQCALLDVDEPISQLHKCALQFPGSPPGGGGTYLCLATEKVVQFQASPCPKEANRALLNDSSCWTIIGTESVEFSFSTSLACTLEPVTPVPLISTLELSGGGDVATLELHGENFHAGLKVWFGDVEAETMYRSPRSLVCVVPDVAAFCSDWRWLRAPITIPVSLVRSDGLFYPSAFSFTYTPEYSARPGHTGVPEPATDADALLESIHQEFTRTNFHLFIQT
ncbi:PREDICTED: recombining binding protein suppressor of hairless-like protein isoform X2 [Cercocebus atys]|uniref:recombining binding protein suppressor of hairless-like protein isoform X2 n=1 Tax=Cercocebus atys TaxID=9531 RepID=UPI0005F3FDCD|nr:PREDICTED: recombining binding protein suppressor of hairless-like protein isoform X2 [Cercocebus atys]